MDALGIGHADKNMRVLTVRCLHGNAGVVLAKILDPEPAQQIIGIISSIVL